MNKSLTSGSMGMMLIKLLSEKVTEELQAHIEDQAAAYEKEGLTCSEFSQFYR